MRASRGARLRLLAGAGVLSVAVGLGAGCGATEGDVAAGKTQFVAACGQCHVLADAETQGMIGPNLDDAFRGARTSGWKDSQFAGVTREWIRIAEPPMPRNLLTGKDADDVAAYVGAVAGTSPESIARAAPEETPEVPTDKQNDENVEAPPQQGGTE